MIDKISPAKRSDIGVVTGTLSDQELDEVEASLRMIFRLV